MRLGAGHTISRKGRRGTMEKTVILETTRTEESLVGMEGLGTREGSDVGTRGRNFEEIYSVNVQERRKGERGECVCVCVCV